MGLPKTSSPSCRGFALVRANAVRRSAQIYGEDLCVSLSSSIAFRLPSSTSQQPKTWPLENISASYPTLSAYKPTLVLIKDMAVQSHCLQRGKVLHHHRGNQGRTWRDRQRCASKLDGSA